MSFCETNELIKEGDTAIVYLSINSMYPIKVHKSSLHNTKYGSLKHSDIIGKPYGTQFKCSIGTVHVLQGSPELWSVCLPHRTQILYSTDISFITLQLDLKPGSVVVESGTGSASLSHSLIRNIYPTGHLHTFEFHEQRSQVAAKEFEEHKLSQYVTVRHRDVCQNGFGLTNIADAVFLDLPSPWKVLPFAKDTLKQEGGRVCSFSPCMEQVQKTVEQLNQLGFVDIKTYETLRRVLNYKKIVSVDFNFDINDNTNNNNNSNKKSKKKSEDNEDDEDIEDDENGENTSVMYSLKPLCQQPGHTGYLTFATLLNKNF